LPLGSILAALETDRNGLDDDEARRRLERDGPKYQSSPG